MTYSVSKTKTTLYFLNMSKCHKIFMHILTRLIFMSNVCTGTKMAFSMVLSTINKICTPQTMNAILANQSAINYSINTRHMTSNGLISLTRLLHHLCINICVFNQASFARTLLLHTSVFHVRNLTARNYRIISCYCE